MSQSFEELLLLDFYPKEVLKCCLEETDDVKPGCRLFCIALLYFMEKDFYHFQAQLYLRGSSLAHRPENSYDLLDIFRVQLEDEVRDDLSPERQPRQRKSFNLRKAFLVKYFGDEFNFGIEDVRRIFALHSLCTLKPLDSKSEVALAFKFLLVLEILSQPLISMLENLHPLSFEAIYFLSLRILFNFIPDCYHLQLLYK